jgi:hypothetical protein
MGTGGSGLSAPAHYLAVTDDYDLPEALFDQLPIWIFPAIGPINGRTASSVPTLSGCDRDRLRNHYV